MPEDAPGNPGARARLRLAAGGARYGGCRPSCTAGREKIPPAGSVTCSTSSMTRTSWPRRGCACGQRGGEDARHRRATVAHDREPGRGRERSWPSIRDSLKSGEFRPCQVRQVMIPKKNGKLRKLGIPTLADRVVQASLKLVLEPIFEADFQPCSYGFRPSRRAQDAICRDPPVSGTRSYHWVLEADIRACFDEIDHTALMDRLRARSRTSGCCALVKSFLKAGVMTPTGNREETPDRHPARRDTLPAAGQHRAVGAGRALRPAMAATDAREQRNKRSRNGLGNWRLIRYADDFVVMVSGERHTPRHCAPRQPPSWPRWGCGWPKRKPAWSTSTRASTSSASPSAACGKEERTKHTSTPSRPGRPSRPSRTRWRRKRTGQPSTSARRADHQHQPALPVAATTARVSKPCSTSRLPRVADQR